MHVAGRELLSVGLWRWGPPLPRVPEGDVLVLGDRAKRATRDFGAAMERIDRCLSQWPVTGVLFLVLAIVLFGTMFVGR